MVPRNKQEPLPTVRWRSESNCDRNDTEKVGTLPTICDMARLKRPGKENTAMQFIWRWIATDWCWFTTDRIIAIATAVYAGVTVIMFYFIRSQAMASHRQANIAEIAAK